ncbi:LysR family transcriptional regulator [Sodalis sp. RH22]|uniref:LysR family transcriptional regulator n=1 Tax=unclassified Sodalis (in: enterobacteria) TaxID=2636512 RepID=UPI0039B49327
MTAQQQSIRLASMILCITPSPLCRTIKMFELSLGHKLFSRTSNGLKLTSYGSELYATLLPLYQEVCELESKILKKNTNKNHIATQYKLGIDHHDYSYLSPLLSDSPFKNEITLEYYAPDSTSMEDVLKEGLCKIFFSDKPLRCPPGVIHQLLAEDALMLAVGSDVNIRNVPINQLLYDKVLVQYEAQLPGKINEEIDAHLQFNNLMLKRLHVPTFQGQLSTIEKSDAIGFFPASVKNIIEERQYKIKLLPFKFRNKELLIQRHIYYFKDDSNWVEQYIAPRIAPVPNKIAC